MLKNCIADYAPAQAEVIDLHQGEVIRHSFGVTLIKKQGLGYRPISTLELGGHLTNQRLILQPIHAGLESVFQSFVLSQIEEFKVVRSLVFTSYAQVCLKPFQGEQSEDVLLAVRAFPRFCLPRQWSFGSWPRPS
jgi:hypothetical protein